VHAGRAGSGAALSRRLTMITKGTALILLLALTPASALGQKGGVFRDPEDGRLDMSK